MSISFKPINDTQNVTAPAPTQDTKELREAKCRRLYNEAIQKQAEGKNEEAEKLYVEMLSSEIYHDSSLSSQSLQLKYLALKNVSDLQYKGNRKTDALIHLVEAVEVDSTDVSVLCRLGRIALELDHISLAKEALLNAITLQPSHWLSVETLSQVFFLLEDFELCIDFIQTHAFKIDPNWRRGHYLISLSKQKLLIESGAISSDESDEKKYLQKVLRSENAESTLITKQVDQRYQQLTYPSTLATPPSKNLVSAQSPTLLNSIFHSPPSCPSPHNNQIAAVQPLIRSPPSVISRKRSFSSITTNFASPTFEEDLEWLLQLESRRKRSKFQDYTEKSLPERILELPSENPTFDKIFNAVYKTALGSSSSLNASDLLSCPVYFQSSSGPLLGRKRSSHLSSSNLSTSSSNQDRHESNRRSNKNGLESHHQSNSIVSLDDFVDDDSVEYSQSIMRNPSSSLKNMKNQSNISNNNNLTVQKPVQKDGSENLIEIEDDESEEEELAAEDVTSILIADDGSNNGDDDMVVEEIQDQDEVKEVIDEEDDVSIQSKTSRNPKHKTSEIIEIRDEEPVESRQTSKQKRLNQSKTSETQDASTLTSSSSKKSNTQSSTAAESASSRKSRRIQEQAQVTIKESFETILASILSKSGPSPPAFHDITAELSTKKKDNNSTQSAKNAEKQKNGGSTANTANAPHQPPIADPCVINEYKLELGKTTNESQLAEHFLRRIEGMPLHSILSDCVHHLCRYYYEHPWSRKVAGRVRKSPRLIENIVGLGSFFDTESLRYIYLYIGEWMLGKSQIQFTSDYLSLLAKMTPCMQMDEHSILCPGDGSIIQILNNEASSDSHQFEDVELQNVSELTLEEQKWMLRFLWLQATHQRLSGNVDISKSILKTLHIVYEKFVHLLMAGNVMKTNDKFNDSLNDRLNDRLNERLNDRFIDHSESLQSSAIQNIELIKPRSRAEALDILTIHLPHHDPKSTLLSFTSVSARLELSDDGTKDLPLPQAIRKKNWKLVFDKLYFAYENNDEASIVKQLGFDSISWKDKVADLLDHVIADSLKRLDETSIKMSSDTSKNLENLPEDVSHEIVKCLKMCLVRWRTCAAASNFDDFFSKRSKLVAQVSQVVQHPLVKREALIQARNALLEAQKSMNEPNLITSEFCETVNQFLHEVAKFASWRVDGLIKKTYVSRMANVMVLFYHLMRICPSQFSTTEIVKYLSFAHQELAEIEHCCCGDGILLKTTIRFLHEMEILELHMKIEEDAKHQQDTPKSNIRRGNAPKQSDEMQEIQNARSKIRKTEKDLYSIKKHGKNVSPLFYCVSKEELEYQHILNRIRSNKMGGMSNDEELDDDEDDEFENKLVPSPLQELRDKLLHQSYSCLYGIEIEGPKIYDWDTKYHRQGNRPLAWGILPPPLPLNSTHNAAIYYNKYYETSIHQLHRFEVDLKASKTDQRSVQVQSQTSDSASTDQNSATVITPSFAFEKLHWVCGSFDLPTEDIVRVEDMYRLYCFMETDLFVKSQLKSSNARFTDMVAKIYHAFREGPRMTSPIETRVKEIASWLNVRAIDGNDLAFPLLREQYESLPANNQSLGGFKFDSKSSMAVDSIAHPTSLTSGTTPGTNFASQSISSTSNQKIILNNDASYLRYKFVFDNIFYLRAMFLVQDAGTRSDASVAVCFETQLLLNPFHIHSLYQLGNYFTNLGFKHLVEQSIRDGHLHVETNDDLKGEQEMCFYRASRCYHRTVSIYQIVSEMRHIPDVHGEVYVNNENTNREEAVIVLDDDHMNDNHISKPPKTSSLTSISSPLTTSTTSSAPKQFFFSGVDFSFEINLMKSIATCFYKASKYLFKTPDETEERLDLMRQCLKQWNNVHQSLPDSWITSHMLAKSIESYHKLQIQVLSKKDRNQLSPEDLEILSLESQFGNEKTILTYYSKSVESHAKKEPVEPLYRLHKTRLTFLKRFYQKDWETMNDEIKEVWLSMLEEFNFPGKSNFNLPPPFKNALQWISDLKHSTNEQDRRLAENEFVLRRERILDNILSAFKFCSDLKKPFHKSTYNISLLLMDETMPRLYNPSETIHQMSQIVNILGTKKIFWNIWLEDIPELSLVESQSYYQIRSIKFILKAFWKLYSESTENDVFLSVKHFKNVPAAPAHLMDASYPVLLLSQIDMILEKVSKDKVLFEANFECLATRVLLLSDLATRVLAFVGHTTLAMVDVRVKKEIDYLFIVAYFTAHEISTLKAANEEDKTRMKLTNEQIYTYGGYANILDKAKICAASWYKIKQWDLQAFTKLQLNEKDQIMDYIAQVVKEITKPAVNQNTNQTATTTN